MASLSKATSPPSRDCRGYFDSMIQFVVAPGRCSCTGVRATVEGAGYVTVSPSHASTSLLLWS